MSSVYPFIRWHEKGRATIRGHGMNEDVGYIAGDKPPNYPMPALSYEVLIGAVVVQLWEHTSKVILPWDYPLLRLSKSFWYG